MLRLIAIALAVTCCVEAQDRMRAGLWENTVTAGGQTATRNACMTPAQAETTKGSVSAMRESREKALGKSGLCKLKDLKIEGNTMTELMVCGATSYQNVTTFRGDSFETTSTSTSAGVAKLSHIKSRRIGDCPKSGKTE